jgi:hypothetical protein
MTRTLKPPHTYLKVFISHATESKPVAQYYYDLLKTDFSVWHYENQMLPGHGATSKPIDELVEVAIRDCDYFMLLICDDSILESRPHCARELGLALTLRAKRTAENEEANCTARPIVIPVYCKNMAWRSKGESARPSVFPVRDFESYTLQEPYSFVGHDPHVAAPARTDLELIEYMKPRLSAARQELRSERELIDSGVFELYDSLFPEAERHDQEDIINWVLHLENGLPHDIYLPAKRTLFRWGGRQKLQFHQNSLFYVVSMYNQPVAFSYFNIHPRFGIITGNYIAAAKSWRNGGLVDRFRRSIEVDVKNLFPNARGIVFDIEPIDLGILERLANQKERSTTLEPIDVEYEQLRRLKRLLFYQQAIGAQIYCDRSTNLPLDHKLPCIDIEVPEQNWMSRAESYWLMWYSPYGHTAPAWKEAVRFIIIEVLVKSLLIRCQNPGGLDIWSMPIA